MGAPGRYDVPNRSPRRIHDHEQPPLDATDRLDPRLAIIDTAIFPLEHRAFEDAAGEGKIKTAFSEARLAFARVAAKGGERGFQARFYTLLAYRTQDHPP